MPKKPPSIPIAIRYLLRIVHTLRQTYPKKRFTLDVRLVGDLGEVLAEKEYDLEIFDELRRHHDARTTDGRLVQIKATMQKTLTFPVDHIPEYYLGIMILEDGSFEEVFNGSGRIVAQAVKNRKPTKTNLHCVAIGTLRRLNQIVPEEKRIARRDAIN